MITLGKPIYFRPVCIQWPWGFQDGPVAYEVTDDPNAPPRIITPPLHEVEDMLDAAENLEPPKARP